MSWSTALPALGSCGFQPILCDPTNFNNASKDAGATNWH